MTVTTIPLDAPTALNRLKGIVGTKNFLNDSNDLEKYATEWTKQFTPQGDALAVALPANTAEVAEIVSVCAAHQLAIVPQGGRTGLCGGGVPVAGQPCVLLSLARMNNIREINTVARTTVVEAGVVLDTLHTKALEHGLVFPLTFGARGSCTLGGNLSTNAGGSNVVRYGNTRELCIGIEAVMPNGTIVNSLAGLRKDNTGYNLKDLLIGAEGTLGIITAAVFKLFPQPLVRSTAFLSVPSVDTALEVLNQIQDQTGGAVEAFEYMPQDMINIIRNAIDGVTQPLQQDTPTGILLEVASSRPSDAETLEDGSIKLQSEILKLLNSLMDTGLVLDAMIAQSEQQRAQLWKMRESALDALIANGPRYGFDISLPLSNISTFISRMDTVCKQLGFKAITLGHLGDGNLHYNLTTGAGQDWATLPLDKAKEHAFSILTELNGSFSAEHGIGQSKLAVMAKLKEPSQLAAMRSIKTALDPFNIMNPGKLLPD